MRADGGAAIDLWSALANIAWHGPDGECVSYFFRAAGDLVANLPAMKARMTHLDAEGVRLRARIRVALTMADAEQDAALRHRAALGQLIERVAAGRAGDDIIRLRDLFGPIALLPAGERGACRLVEVGKSGST